MGEIARQPCPFVGCYSSDAFFYNEDEGVGKCHSCGTGFPCSDSKLKPEYRGVYLKPHELNGETTMTTQKLAVVPEANLTPYRGEYRGIRNDTMSFYGVTTYADAEGSVVKQNYVYPSGGIKTRVHPKTFTASGLKQDELFGMDKFNSASSTTVVVTEGELDAMSAFQMLDKKYPVVSMPSANPSKKLWLGPAKDFLESFQKIIVSTDNDDAGNGLADKLASMFPNKVYRIPHDKFKDANEFLQNGASPSYRSAFRNVKKYTPQNVWNTSDQFLSILHEKDDAKYIPTGIQAFDDIALGLMQGHMTVFQAPEGIGKTEFMRYLEYHMIKNHPNVPIAICHLEETKKRSLLGLASYHLGKDVTRQDLIDSNDLQEQVDQAVIDMTSSENLYQFQIGVDEDPMVLLERIRFFRQACGVEYIFFEPIQDLAYGRTTDDSIEKWLSALSVQLSRMAAELNVGIVTIAHENDDGQIRDCRTIGKRASVVIKLERDKMAQDDDSRNTTTLLVTKNRPAGTTGHGGSLFFDADSFTLSEKFDRFA